MKILFLKDYIDPVYFLHHWGILSGQYLLLCVSCQHLQTHEVDFQWKIIHCKWILASGWLNILLIVNVYTQIIYTLNIKCNWYIGSRNGLHLSRTESNYFSLRLKMTQFTFLLFISYLFSAMEHSLQYWMYWVEVIKMFVQYINELWTNINRTILATWRATIGPVT